MDIISYSKAKKAGKAVKVANKRIGHTDKFKHGDEDVKDIYVNTDERIQQMELKIAPAKLNTLLTEESARTMINLAKHELKIISSMRGISFNHHNLYYNPMNSSSGLTLKNCTFNSTKKAIVSTLTPGTILTDSISTSTIPQKISVSLLYEGYKSKEIEVDLINGIHNSTETTDYGLMLEGIIGVGYNGKGYVPEGNFITNTIDLGEDFSIITKISANYYTNDGTLKLYISSSDDNKTFDDFREFNLSVDLTSVQFTKRYIKLKIYFKSRYEDTSAVNMLDFTSADDSYFENETKRTLNGSLSLKNFTTNEKVVIKGIKDLAINPKITSRLMLNKTFKTFSSSNLVGSGNGSGSSYQTMYYPWKAFDGLKGQTNAWASAKNDNPAWLVYDFYSPVIVTSYSMYFNTTASSKNAPSKCTLYGSNDNSSWTKLDLSYFSFSNNETKTASFSNSKGYRYYKFDVESVGKYVRISEISMYGPTQKTGNLRIAISPDSGESWIGSGGKLDVSNTSEFYSKGYTATEFDNITKEFIENTFTNGTIRFSFLIEEFLANSPSIFLNQIFAYLTYAVSVPAIKKDSLKLFTEGKKGYTKPKVSVSRNAGDRWMEIDDVDSGRLYELDKLPEGKALKLKIDVAGDTIYGIAQTWV